MASVSHLSEEGLPLGALRPGAPKPPAHAIEVFGVLNENGVVEDKRPHDI